ncbi:poly polymerase and DNA-ligase Zn-finger region-domain-containing protein, partial [Tricharina praecox]|uniref:poly polymerase and DNA-ligase Zn-finger region-domain-containing protein n=1 Tax=Tricharina praecox TaxID=43433 RepID=UPI00221ED3F9
ENATSSRAKCKATTCGHDKILKDELRQGTFVTIRGVEKGTWAWRHWGCVTAKQMSNIKASLMDGDNINWDLCDGLEELTEDDKVKVREAIQRGWVADDD